MDKPRETTPFQARLRRQELQTRTATITLYAHPETPKIKAFLEMIVTAGLRQSIVTLDQKEVDQLIGWFACFVETGNLPR